MENCLMSYYVLNSSLKDTCECNPAFFEEAPSIYEVIRVEQGVPLFLEDHIKRFFHSAVLWGEGVSVSTRQIRSRIKAVIEANGLVSGLIKFLYLNHPVSGALFAAWVTPFYFPSEETYKKGVELISLKGVRINPNAKVSNQKVRKLADEIIKKQKVYEVMLVNENDIITEGSRSNLFFIKAKTIHTADRSLVLEGVTRSKIIELALHNGIEVAERKIHISELPVFDAAFITGTTPKVMPVRKINQFGFDVNNPVLRQLMQHYQELIDEYLKGHIV